MIPAPTDLGRVTNVIHAAGISPATMQDIIRTRGISLPAMSVTNNQPSQMDGGKDFSDWSKRDKLLADTLGPMVTAMLGKWGKGLVDNALGESFYEKGVDGYTVLSRLTRALSDSEAGGVIEQSFVSIGIQVRMSLLSGDEHNAYHLLDSFEKRVRRENADRLLPNLAALRCRVDLRTGNENRVKAWMDQAPDEVTAFNVLQRYEYMTKVRCLIAERSYMVALSLLLRMRQYAAYAKRPHLMMEIALLEAIVLRQCGEPWQEGFVQMLNKAQEYRFVRLISEQGAAVLPLLKESKGTFLEQEGADKVWFSQVLEETKKVAELYPNYLNASTVTAKDFSPQALEILRLQAAGKTIKEISRTLGMAERTVKYHATENYARLRANGKTDAVQKAKQLKLI